MTETEKTTRPPERIAVFSCIHGNMEALEAAYSDARAQDVDRIVCLGDLVGYVPYPNEVVRFIARKDIHTVVGCWDEAIVMDNEDCGCKFVSEEDEAFGALAFGFTKDRMRKKQVDFLKEMYWSIRMEDTPAGELLFVHGSPRDTSEYMMETTHDLILLERAAGAYCDVLFCGHTHVPFVRRIGGSLTVMPGNPGDHEPDARILPLSQKLIINAGSIGEPRHGSPESTYVIFDTESRQTEIRRVEYPVEKTVQAMRKLNLPEVFAQRLLTGEELVGKHKEIVCAC